jgi:hypothetical protein
MTVRVDLKAKVSTSLDNVIMKQGDRVTFNDVAELDPPIPERLALLKLCRYGETVTGIGVKLDDATYIVQEL